MNGDHLLWVQNPPTFDIIVVFDPHKEECFMSKEKLLGIIRHSLTFFGGFLMAKGLVDEATLNVIVTGVIALVGVVWSWKVKD